MNSLSLDIFLYFLITIELTLFLIHWFSLRHLSKPEERLKYSRGSYIGYSSILLLACWLLFFIRGQDSALLFLAVGYTTSFIGDIFNLQFNMFKNRVKEPLLFGILFFMISQLLYISSFINIVGINKLLSFKFFYPILSIVLILITIIFKLKVYSKKREKSILVFAYIYGLFLGTMTSISLSLALAIGGYWWYVFIGSLIFLLSDASMGGSTIKGRHPKTEYQIPWLTYLIAQGLILFTYLVV